MDWAAAVLAPVPTLRQRGYGMKHNALLQHAGIVGGSLVPSVILVVATTSNNTAIVGWADWYLL